MAPHFGQTARQYCIMNERSRYPVFVANRLAIIRDGSNPQQWRYVPSTLNPADYASRGLNADELISKSDWLNCPQFLYQSEEEWPKQDEEDSTSKDTCDTKSSIQKEEVYVTQTKAANDVINDPTDQLLNYYSDWTKLKRAVAWWIQFKQYLLLKMKKQESEPVKKNEHNTLSVEDLSNAEKAVVKYVQNQGFSSVLKSIQVFTTGK